MLTSDRTASHTRDEIMSIRNAVNFDYSRCVSFVIHNICIP